MEREGPWGRVVVLNGGSSSGKTTIGRQLQVSFRETWVLIGIDVLIWLLPMQMMKDPDGLLIQNGVVRRGTEFMRLYLAFQQAVATLARSGVNVILDDVMHDGLVDRRRWERAFVDVDTLWVGIHCDSGVVQTREKERGDRPRGLARNTAASCHRDIDYDIEVDTSMMEVDAAVQHIVSGIGRRWPAETAPSSKELPVQPPISALTKNGSIGRAPWEHDKPSDGPV
jgi:chloramphenicol 3-O phosphotransferase